MGVLVVLQIVTAAGTGAAMQTALVALQASMPHKDVRCRAADELTAQMPMTTAVYGQVRLLGGSIGISIGSTIISSQFRSRAAGIVAYSPPSGVLDANVTRLYDIQVRFIRDTADLTLPAA